MFYVEEQRRTQHSFPFCLIEDVGCLYRRVKCIKSMKNRREISFEVPLPLWHNPHNVVASQAMWGAIISGSCEVGHWSSNASAEHWVDLKFA